MGHVDHLYKNHDGEHAWRENGTCAISFCKANWKQDAVQSGALDVLSQEEREFLYGAETDLP